MRDLGDEPPDLTSVRTIFGCRRVREMVGGEPPPVVGSANVIGTSSATSFVPRAGGTVDVVDVVDMVDVVDVVDSSARSSGSSA